MSDKDALEWSAERSAPKSTETKKRKAPDADKSPAQLAAARRARQVRQGVRKSYRLHPDLPPAIVRAAKANDVSQRAMVEYFLTLGLRALAEGKVKLPKVKRAGLGPGHTIEPQPLPDEFAG